MLRDNFLVIGLIVRIQLQEIVSEAFNLLPLANRNNRRLYHTLQAVGFQSDK